MSGFFLVQCGVPIPMSGSINERPWGTGWWCSTPEHRPWLAGKLWALPLSTTWWQGYCPHWHTALISEFSVIQFTVHTQCSAVVLKCAQASFEHASMGLEVGQLPESIALPRHCAGHWFISSFYGFGNKTGTTGLLFCFYCYHHNHSKAATQISFCQGMIFGVNEGWGLKKKRLMVLLEEQAHGSRSSPLFFICAMQNQHKIQLKPPALEDCTTV